MRRLRALGQSRHRSATELARRDSRRGARGLPGRSAADAARDGAPRVPAERDDRRRVGVLDDSAELGLDLGRGRGRCRCRAEQRARVHLPQRRQRRAEHDRPGVLGPVLGLRFQARQHRPRARSLQWRECRHDRDGWDRRRARVRQPRRVRRRQQRRLQGVRHALRRWLGRCRLGPRGVPGHRLPATEPVPLREP